MTSINTVYKDFGNPVCRRYINRKYHVNLQADDCRYDGPYPYACPNCQEVRRIVVGFSFFGKMKLLFRR